MAEYRDPTRLTETERKNINLLATAIRQKMYGIDVRESIALAIELLLDISSKENNDAYAEVVKARNEFGSLDERLDDMLADLQNISVSQINKNLGKLDSTYFSDEFLTELAGGTINTTNVLDGAITTSKLANKSITDNKITDNAITFTKLATDIQNALENAGFKIDSYTNLFDKTKAKTGYYLNSNGAEVTSSGSAISDFTPVEPNETYIVNEKLQQSGWSYDASYNAIAPIFPYLEPAETPFAFTTPSNAAYIKFNVQWGSHNATSTGYIDSFMLVKGGTLPEQYLAYGETQTLVSYVPGLSNIDSPLKGKQIITNGDSITWYDGKTYLSGTLEAGNLVRGYQTHIAERTGAIVTNKGVSGDTMQQIAEDILVTDYLGYDIATIFGGMNNYRDSQEGDLGAILPIGSTFDKTKFTGALQASIEHILTSNQDIDLRLITPQKGWYTDNSHQPMTTAIPDRILEIGELYGLSVCDLYRNSGINQLTGSIYIVDNSAVWRFHPSTKGYERIADILIPFLERS